SCSGFAVLAEGVLSPISSSARNPLDRWIRLFQEDLGNIVITIFDLVGIVALCIAGDDIHGKFFISGKETYSFDHSFDKPLNGVPRLPDKLSRGHDVAVQRFDAVVHNVQ